MIFISTFTRHPAVTQHSAHGTVSQVKDDLNRGCWVGVGARAGPVPGERKGSASSWVLSLGHRLHRHLGTGTLIKG